MSYGFAVQKSKVILNLKKKERLIRIFQDGAILYWWDISRRFFIQGASVLFEIWKRHSGFQQASGSTNIRSVLNMAYIVKQQ